MPSFLLRSLAFVGIVTVVPLAHSQAPAGNPNQPDPNAVHAVSALFAAPPVGASSLGDASNVTPDLFSGILNSSIPLEVPVGRAGMQPTLTLHYRSSNGNGILGVGWDLDIGSIERNTHSGVDYSSDSYVYRTPSGTSSLVSLGNNEYRAQIESFFYRFRKLNALDGRPYWEVTDRSGKQYLYGETSMSRLDDPSNPNAVFRWCLDKVIDTDANYLTASYTKDSGQIYIAEIDFAGYQTNLPTNTIKFHFAPRQDVPPSFLTNFEVRTKFRLDKIEVLAAGNIVRSYELGYDGASTAAGQSTSTGRSLLSTVTLKSANGGESIPASSLTYSSSSTGSGWQAPVWGGGPGPGIPVGGQCLTGDFNGDGKTDMACYTGAGGNWHMALSTGSGWQAPVWGGGPGPGIPVGNQCLTGDFNGDGKTDMACYTGAGGNWHMALSTGSGWQAPVWGGGPGPGIPVGNQCLTGDFNGDGKTDMACYTGAGGNWHMALATGSGWQAPVWGSGPGPAIPVGNQCLTGDFNGDGKTDVACYTGAGGSWHVAQSSGSDWQASFWSAGPGPGIPIFNQCLPGDFSGDGKTDIACYTGAGGNWHVGVSNGEIPDLLVNIRNTAGGETHIEYKPSTSYPNTLLTFSIQVVAAVTTNDGRGTSHRTDMSYSGGFYYIPEKDFRGFAIVREIGPPSTDGSQLIKETDFHQGNDIQIDVNNPDVPTGYLKGAPFRVTTLDTKGNLYNKIETGYKLMKSEPYAFAPPERIDSYTCLRSQCPKDVRTAYNYDDYGNVVKEIAYGDVDDATKVKTIVRTYAINEARWIIDLPASEAIFRGADSNAVQVSGTQYFYDGGATDCTIASTNQIPSLGHLTRIVPWLGSPASHAEQRLAYDAWGNVTCKADSRGNTTHFSYDSSHTYLASVVDALGHVFSTKYYGIDDLTSHKGLYGQTKEVTDANNATTYYEYDQFGRRILEQHPGGNIIKMSYVSLGNPAQQHIRSELPLGLYSEEYFDGYAREYLRYDAGAAHSTIVVDTEYDNRGLVGKRSTPYFKGVSNPHYETYEYDVLGRPTAIHHADGSSRFSCYGMWSVSIVDEDSHLVRQAQDGIQELVRVDEYLGRYKSCEDVGEAITALPYSSTKYDYDILGHPTTVIDAKGHQTTILYDVLGRRKGIQDPDLGHWTYRYDEDGNMVEQTDARGKSIFFKYDALNRLIQKDFLKSKKLGAGDIRYRYDAAAPNGIGRLASVRASTFAKELRYDSEGRVIHDRRTLKDKNFELNLTYDVVGRPATITYPDGGVIDYDYDGPALSKVRDSGHSLATYTGFTSLNQPEFIDYGNGVRTAVTYAGANNQACSSENRRICTISTTNREGSKLQDWFYRYDNIGNVTQASDGPITKVYVYDELDRLVAAGEAQDKTPVVYPSLPAGHKAGSQDILTLLKTSTPRVNWHDGYSYDEIGNIVWSSELGEYRYPAGNGSSAGSHAVIGVGRQQFRYDRNGNMSVGYGGARFSFGTDNRLATVESQKGSVSYSYDENGVRFASSEDEEDSYFFDKLYECKEESCSRLIYAGSRLLAKQIVESGKIYYIHQDAQGSTTVVTDVAGNLVEKRSYETFGTPTKTASTGVVQSYTGKDYQATAGLYFFETRFYDPRLGRFISPDSDVPDPASPRNLNRYCYALNNPVTLTDPNGHFAWFIPIIVGAIIGGTNAAVHHDNILKGMAIGAIGGAFVAGAGAIGGGFYAQLGLQAAAGAGAGATNAVIWGSSPGDAALYGAAFGAAGYAISGLTLLHSSSTDEWLAGNAKYLVNGSVHGALINGAYGAFTGENVLNSLSTGALQGVEGAGFNMGVGHTLGLVAWAYGGAAPVWKDGAWFYKSNPDTPGLLGELLSGVTVGNVITGNGMEKLAGCHSMEECGGSATRRTYDHELSHIPQSYELGFGYVPVNILSMFVGATIELSPTDFKGAGHRNGLMERYWINVTDYDKKEAAPGHK
jgi:RHS repeat-associated protein